MKANLKSIIFSALATSVFWMPAIGAFLWSTNRGSHQKEYVAVFSVPSRPPTPSRLVIEQLDANYASPHGQIVQRSIPAGETQHFGIRIVQTAANTNQ